MKKANNTPLTMNTKLTVSESNRVSHGGAWDRKVSLNELIDAGWEFNEHDLAMIANGGTATDVSPNGRRKIFVTL